MLNNIPYNLSKNDLLIRKDDRLVIHKKYKDNDFSIGAIHNTRYYGMYKIINEHKERADNGQKILDIQFLATGTIKTVRKGNLNKGVVRDEEIWKLLIGKRYIMNSGKSAIIINAEFRGKDLYCEIKFDSSGKIKWSKINTILDGSVKDPEDDIDNKYLNKIFTNSYGSYKVIKRLDERDKHGFAKFVVKFIDTGYEIETTSNSIQSNNIRDPYHPTVCGVGYLGEGYEIFRKTDRELYDALINRWMLMMFRCYSKTDGSYYAYGAKGVRVSDRWLNFSNYLNDVIKLDNYDRDLVINNKLQLDKDKLQKGVINKIYSKDTCIWLTPIENNPHNNK